LVSHEISLGEKLVNCAIEWLRHHAHRNRCRSSANAGKFLPTLHHLCS
jgi:hypothetical protein